MNNITPEEKQFREKTRFELVKNWSNDRRQKAKYEVILFSLSLEWKMTFYTKGSSIIINGRTEWFAAMHIYASLLLVSNVVFFGLY